MATPEPGDLVQVTTSGPTLDAIVFDVPSHTKVIVAVMDRAKGPVFRTVDPSTVAIREQPGSQDAPLRALIRRTPVPTHSTGRDIASGGSGRSGFKRGAAHRSTGR
jgi:hypothetical protein